MSCKCGTECANPTQLNCLTPTVTASPPIEAGICCEHTACGCLNITLQAYSPPVLVSGWTGIIPPVLPPFPADPPVLVLPALPSIPPFPGVIGGSLGGC